MTCFSMSRTFSTPYIYSICFLQRQVQQDFYHLDDSSVYMFYLHLQELIID